MANYPSPDSILDQSRRTKTQLTPAAQHISTFKTPTKDDVPEPPQTNMVSQLGDALSKLSGTMTQATAYAKQIQDAKDLAAGEEESRRLQAMNIDRIDKAVQAGELPAGASPVFKQAVREHLLGSAADKRKRSLSEAYWNSEEGAAVRNSENPAAFDEFVSKHNAAFDQGALLDANGEKAYTDLDLHRSKYHDRAAEDTRALYREHLAFRVAETERQAEQVAGLRTTRAIEEGLDQKLSHADIAKAVAGIYRDPVNGLVVHGLPPSKQSTLTVDAIIDAAVNRRDPKVLDMLDSVQTGFGNVLGGTTYARKQSEAARERIQRLNYADMTHREEQAKLEATGTFEERAAYYRQQWDETKHTKAREHFVDLYTNRILQYDPANMTAKTKLQQETDLNDLRKVDAKAAAQLEEHIVKMNAQRDAKIGGRRSDLTEMELLNAISKTPGPRANKLIDQALRDERITGEAFRRLRNESDQQGQAHLKFSGVLKDPMVTNIFEGTAKAAIKDETALFGEGSIASASAEHEMRMLAIEFLNKQPTASASQLAEYLLPRMSPTVDKYNALTRQAHEEAKAAAKERQRVIEQVNREQEEAHEFVRQLRAGTPTQKKPTPAEMREALKKGK